MLTVGDFTYDFSWEVLKFTISTSHFIVCFDVCSSKASYELDRLLDVYSVLVFDDWFSVLRAHRSHFFRNNDWTSSYAYSNNVVL